MPRSLRCCGHVRELIEFSDAITSLDASTLPHRASVSPSDWVHSKKSCLNIFIKTDSFMNIFTERGLCVNIIKECLIIFIIVYFRSFEQVIQNKTKQYIQFIRTRLYIVRTVTLIARCIWLGGPLLWSALCRICICIRFIKNFCKKNFDN